MSGRAASVDALIDLFVRHGGDHYDEEISQLDHALQTAALAVGDGADEPLVAAALLHDVGHLLELADGADGPAEIDLGHEQRGARFLTSLFPPSVTAPIALHVTAKRYRCAVDAGYHDGLSDGSRRSLVLQGGPMSPAEVVAFESRHGHDDAVRLRGWDDAGKVDGLLVEPLDHYRPLLDRLARSREGLPSMP